MLPKSLGISSGSGVKRSHGDSIGFQMLQLLKAVRAVLPQEVRDEVRESVQVLPCCVFDGMGGPSGDGRRDDAWMREGRQCLIMPNVSQMLLEDAPRVRTPDDYGEDD